MYFLKIALYYVFLYNSSFHNTNQVSQTSDYCIPYSFLGKQLAYCLNLGFPQSSKQGHVCIKSI